MLLTEEYVAALRELNCRDLSIQVSLDGASSRSHDLVRGAGAFDATLQNLSLLVREGFGESVSIFFTEMNHNLDEIPELLELADRLGIGSVSSGCMVLCGRASATSILAPPREEQYLALLERYDRDPLFRELYGRLGTVAALEWRSGDAIRHDCCSFVENPYLNSSGRLYPCLMCHADEFSVSGVFDKGLAAALVEGVPLWTALLRISRSRADEIPECRDCPGRLRCAGGCMGRAWGSCGDLRAADDRCRARRAIYQR
jgi:radical SAM protein with 4Fe4S-binding SPASM domain